MEDLESNIFDFGKFRLDKVNKVLRHSGEIVALPLKAVELLCLLVENQNEVVSKNDILDKVWENSFVDEGVLTQNIHKLRKVFEEYGEKDLIKNVARRGYIFSYENVKETSLTIERETFEEIQITEESSFTFSKPQNLGKVIWISAVLLLLFGGITAILYLRPKSESKKNSVISVSPLAVSNSKLKTVAVLPFTISDEKETSFAQSFTSDLTTRIGSLNKFNVKPYFIVKTAKNIKSDFILTGEITTKNNRLAVNVNVRDVRNNTNILKKSFDSEQADLIKLQDSITNEAVNSILENLPVGEKEELSKRLPTNFAAYEMYQKGLEIWRKRQDASSYFKKAIELDANLAKAYVGLASTKIFTLDEKELIKQNLDKANEIEPNSPDANAIIGFIKIFQEHDWIQAETALKNSLEGDETNVNAHHWLAVYYAIHNRLNEAKVEIKNAIELDEANPTLSSDAALIHYFANEKDLAKLFCNRAFQLDSTRGAECSKFDRPMPDKYSALKEVEQESIPYNLVYLNVDPRYSEIRNEPQIKEILRKLNLDAK
jgi:DNA-binding winged helix-turn-helix (wHTH) protein/TolB-like protein